MSVSRAGRWLLLFGAGAWVALGPACDDGPSGDGDSDVDSDVDADGDADEDGDRPFRPFADDSPWNTPISSDPELEPDSDALIADLETSSPWGEHLDVNIAGYSIPLYWADASTPRVEMRCRVGGLGFEGDNGMDAVATVPMPEAAAPDPESDHHLLVIDRSTSLVGATLVASSWAARATSRCPARRRPRPGRHPWGGGARRGRSPRRRGAPRGPRRPSRS